MGYWILALLLLLLLAQVAAAAASSGDLFGGKERYLLQPLNHNDALVNVRKVRQRYFWYPPPNPSAKSTVLFFYAGNEAKVENYIKSCGLMHENAKLFNAGMIFAEHRFWGKSLPFGSKRQTLGFAGPDQAILDYLKLIDHVLVREEASSFAPRRKVRVIAFGGSYGGMLAAWMRLKHPDVIHAAVASSAPVLGFPLDMRGQPTDFYGKDGKKGGSAYWNVVTKVYKRCSNDVYAALLTLGQADAAQQLGVCPSATTTSPTHRDLLMWIGYALETLAMGDYHFPSDYITGTVLPARPTQLACDRLLASQARGRGGLRAVRAALDVFYNPGRLLPLQDQQEQEQEDMPCLHVPDRFNASFYDGLWDQYWCRWLVPQETYFAMEGPPNDMFLPLPLDWSEIAQHCKQETKSSSHGMDFTAINRWFGAVSEQEWERQASKIIFVNGGHDPWSAAGYYSTKNPTLPCIFIETGAHHVDLMFAREDDPEDVTEARRQIIDILKQWFSVSGEELEEGLGREGEVAVA